MDLIPAQPILWREDSSNSDYSVVFFQGCTKQVALAKRNLRFRNHSSSLQETWISVSFLFWLWKTVFTDHWLYGKDLSCKADGIFDLPYSLLNSTGLCQGTAYVLVLPLRPCCYSQRSSCLTCQTRQCDYIFLRLNEGDFPVKGEESCRFSNSRSCVLYCIYCVS